jgi:UDP-N-acetylglucosamine acyltransferase
VEDRAFISGGVVVHQYSKVGQLAMIGGNTRINKDVPPFVLAVGFNAEAVGINLVGLRRAGLSREQIRNARNAFKT